jgi:phosphotransferase system enzyme I (PtsP)
MGWRSIRISLDHPAMLRGQLRALVKAIDGRELHVMFPMISNVQEFIQSKALLDIELKDHQSCGGTMPKSVSVGAMLEVPALGFQLEALLKHCDFISIGSNDLMQFLFARDRGNPRLSGRYDTLSPAVLSFIRSVVLACDKAGKPLSLCGEMAGFPIEAMALIGLGLRQLSMVPSSIGTVKAMLLSLDQKELEDYMLPLLESGDLSLRNKLRNFAQDHKIKI